MGEIIDFPDLEYNIAAERTEEFFVAARALSDFIKNLPLDNADNEKLIKLVVDQVNIAEVGAFYQGIRLSVSVNEYMQEPDK